MTNEQKERIEDFFDPWELIELLQVKMEDIVDAFEEYIEEAIDDLEEIMGVRNG